MTSTMSVGVGGTGLCQKAEPVTGTSQRYGTILRQT